MTKLRLSREVQGKENTYGIWQFLLRTWEKQTTVELIKYWSIILRLLRFSGAPSNHKKLRKSVCSARVGIAFNVGIAGHKFLKQTSW